MVWAEQIMLGKQEMNLLVTHFNYHDKNMQTKQQSSFGPKEPLVIGWGPLLSEAVRSSQWGDSPRFSPFISSWPSSNLAPPPPPGREVNPKPHHRSTSPLPGTRLRLTLLWLDPKISYLETKALTLGASEGLYVTLTADTLTVKWPKERIGHLAWWKLDSNVWKL